MSRPKGGRSVQLLGTAFESERSRHFPYMDLFSSKCCFHNQSTTGTLGAPRSRCNARDNSKIVTRG